MLDSVVETLSETLQKSKIKNFAKQVNDFYPLTIFANLSMLDI